MEHLSVFCVVFFRVAACAHRKKLDKLNGMGFNQVGHLAKGIVFLFREHVDCHTFARRYI